jgi:hypothetical protein
MKNRHIVAALVATLVTAGSIGALAKGAVAVGETGDVATDGVSMGVAIDADNEPSARETAMGHCQNIGGPKSKAACRIIRVFDNMCAVSALDPDAGTPGWGWAIASTKEEAADTAMAQCKATAGSDRQDKCVLDVQLCDGKAK